MEGKTAVWMGRWFAAFAGFILLWVEVAAEAEEGKPNLGRLAWSAFVCAGYSEIAGKKDEQKRLFEVGYDAGRRFVEGVENHTISEVEIRRAPMGVTLLLAGPSVDFIVGRIFENALGDAYDDVVKEDENGLPLDYSAWRNDDALRSVVAQNKYLRSNCTLIR